MQTDLHTLPFVGHQKSNLYAPADYIYQVLKDAKEVSRLNALKHLGAYSFIVPGARHARWDYTHALLFYIEKLHDLRGLGSSFRIGNTRFSSGIAALQSIALVWNIGHLPGTFAVEKGVARHLLADRSPDPANKLSWPHKGDARVNVIIKEASRFLRDQDYLGVSRVLATNKLLSYCAKNEGVLFEFICDYAAPLFFDYYSTDSKQWAKLKTAFRMVRHLAYLTLDAPYSGIQWGPSVPIFFDHQVRLTDDIDKLAAITSETLSPIERMTYQNIYHCDVARKESASLAAKVEDHLSKHADPNTEIQQWCRAGLMKDVRIGRLKSSHFSLSASVKLRGFFSQLADPPTTLESSLKEKGFQYPNVAKYVSWNSDAILEPDEIQIDAFSDGPPKVTDVGRLIIWLINRYQKFDASINDHFQFMQQLELEPSYIELLRRAFELRFPNISVRLSPWPLSEFGLFESNVNFNEKGLLWPSNAKLDNTYTNHIVRSRRSHIPAHLSEAYSELEGIAALRRHIRASWKSTGKEPRSRWIVVTGSVILHDTNRSLIEFDGGIVKISMRTGDLFWYGLETKSGRENPYRSLSRRISVLGLSGSTVKKISNDHAFVEIKLS